MTQQGLSTPLYQSHINAGAKIVDFAGYLLPINYGSQIKEHEAVRTDAGMFDVSHMVITDISGEKSKEWLRYLLANDVAKLVNSGKALYTAALNEHGCVLDDLIVYLMDFGYRLVSNAAMREKDLAWFAKTAKAYDVKLTVRDDLAILAVQGPNAIEKLLKARPEWSEKVKPLTAFVGAYVDNSHDIFVAKTGYTGEDGVEIIIADNLVESLFNALKAQNITPCGLGARDTLRLEAGMNLYGHDMDETVTPLQAGMAWTISFTDDRDFIGKSALLQQKSNGIVNKQMALVLEGKGILREGMSIIVANQDKGIITSGTFSPTLGHSIAIARVPSTTKLSDEVQIDIRGKLVNARLVKLPFVSNGKKQFD